MDEINQKINQIASEISQIDIAISKKLEELSSITTAIAKLGDINSSVINAHDNVIMILDRIKAGEYDTGSMYKNDRLLSNMREVLEGAVFLGIRKDLSEKIEAAIQLRSYCKTEIESLEDQKTANKGALVALETQFEEGQD